MKTWGIFLLLHASVLLAFVPTATAESTAVLQFDHDPQSEVDNVVIGPAPDAPPPDYLQAQSVGIRVQSTGTPWVRVQCVESCHNLTTVYYARWTGDPTQWIYFPQNFNQPGPNGDGGNAIADGVPKYNGTWEATALITGAPVTRRFNTWLMDVYTTPGKVGMPGAEYFIHGRGYTPRVEIVWRIDHLTAAGQWTTIHGPVTTKSIDTLLYERWRVPKEEAARMVACAKLCDAYRLVLSGGGKETETVPFRMSPALIVPIPLDVPMSGETFQRTENLTATYAFRYPGGNLAFGEAFLPIHLPDSAANPTKGLRVRVELRDNATDPADTELLNETHMVYVPEAFAWRVTWSAPKDLDLGALSNRGQIVLRLAETRDRWGNVVPAMDLGTYNVTAATLTPRLLEDFRELPRAQDGRVALQISYLNGTPWTASDNSTPLRACFARESATLPTCPPDANVLGVFEGNGTWSFKIHYEYNHSDLESYRFKFPASGTVNDKWNNTVTPLELEPYAVVPGSPRIEFRTVMRGFLTDTFERGNSVTLQAVIKYADGRPFNHLVQPMNARFIDVVVVKRAATGEIVDERPVTLQETDASVGRFVGRLDLTRDEATTPLGDWLFRFEVRDNVTVPNVNVTTFNRTVVAAPIQLQATREPSGVISTGSVARYRFQLTYEDGARVAPDAVNSRLEARIYEHNGTAPVGEPVSGRLVPVHDGEAFQVEYVIPQELFQGRYAFVISGTDRFGNRIQLNSGSRPFSTFAEAEPRAVLTQPALAISRGESAAVVFDGDAGDLGSDGRGMPSIRLERWDPVRAAWIVERADARRFDFETSDHLGVFEVGETTTIGVYRFVMEGRSARFHPFEAVSANFTVVPTEVTRALLVPPPRAITKGELFEFTIERRDGDQITRVESLYNGRVVSMQPPTLTYRGTSTNVTWRIPFEAASGNYSLVLRGVDVFGNDLLVRTPAFEARVAQLSGRIIGQPPPVAERGSPVKLLFGITFPEGGFYAAPEAPRVLVRDAQGSLVATALASRVSLAYEATWTPPSDARAGSYYFEIAGRGAGDNVFPSLTSDSFTVSAGTFSRSITDEVPSSIERGATVTFGVATSNEDADVVFKLLYYGPTNDPQLASRNDPTSETEIPHTLDVPSGRYLVQFPTTLSTDVGAYRIVMLGEDKEGNALRTESRPFLVTTHAIFVRWGSFPGKDAFGEGKTITLTFRAEYRASGVMDDTKGLPNVAILYNNQPITLRPSLAFENGQWALSWTAPNDLLPGTYSFTTGGFDFNGNPIFTSTSTTYTFETDAATSFAKSVPGAEVWALALAVVIAVALIGRKRR